MTTFRPAAVLTNIAVFVLASAGTYLAQSMDRPVTAVLIYLSGVIIIATHSGLLFGICAAVAASITFNFFLSEPAFQFGLTTADEAVPLIAFNLCAILAGALIGRLRDSANVARSAQAQTAFLLTVSDRLQRAIKIGDIEGEIRSILPTQSVKEIEIYLVDGDHYVRPSVGTDKIDKFRPLLNMDERGDSAGIMRIVELQGSDTPLGIVKFRLAEAASDRVGMPDLQSLSNLLALAVERCLLLDRVSDARASLRSDELKDAIFSSVSHDLRTPLTAIEAAASALSSAEVTLPPSDQKELLRSILGQCRRLNRYTADLLDMGQIQAGISSSQFETVELADLLNLAVNRAKTGSNEIAVERHFAPEPLYVLANAMMLEQAFFNIIENAIKYGGEHALQSASIIVSLGVEDDHGLVAITDNGPGISESDRQKIFSRFFKSDAGVGREGSGLGLFIAKGFIDAFDGNIEILTPLTPTGGTRMEVRLPLIPQFAALEAA